MNPAIFTILAWEKELEIQSQADRYDPGVILSQHPKPRRENHKSSLSDPVDLADPQDPTTASL